MLSKLEQQALANAIKLGKCGIYSAAPNPRVGAVIIDNQAIIAEGWHEKTGGPHAEIVAINDAASKGCSIAGKTMVVTLEPCNHQGKTPPCTEAIIKSGIKRLIVATLDPNPVVATNKAGSGIQQCIAAGIEVVTPSLVQEYAPLLAKKAIALNQGFFKRHRQQRPWIVAKMAMSMDGRTALANGQSQWITGEAARHDSQYWRARSCALITGIGTVLHDDPNMTVRHPPNINITDKNPHKGHYREPLKVVLDSLGAMPATARILKSGQVLTIGLYPTGASFPDAYHSYWQAPEDKGRINLWAVAEELARRECNEILLEAGPVLTGAFLEAGLVDQLVVYMAPKFLGNTGLPFAHFTEAPSLDQSWGLHFDSATPLAEDLRLIYSTAKS